MTEHSKDLLLSIRANLIADAIRIYLQVNPANTMGIDQAVRVAAEAFDKNTRDYYVTSE